MDDDEIQRDRRRYIEKADGRDGQAVIECERHCKRGFSKSKHYSSPLEVELHVIQMHRCCLLLLGLFSTIFSLHQPRGAYVHIPFCRRRCFYCNFPVVVVGERQSSQELQGTMYTALLLREMEATIQSSEESLGALETVYFGGGTPSLLPTECQYETLLH
jgi:coproporphyrinogen III oxidase-like Fe-S oxidoreductase